MTSSPKMPVRLRFDLLEKWHVAQSAGNWESEATAPDSDVRLGEVDSFSAMFGHAHGAQIPEAQEAVESNSFREAQEARVGTPGKDLGQFQVQSFPQTAFEKVK